MSELMGGAAALLDGRPTGHTAVAKLAASMLGIWFVYLLLGSTNGFSWIESWHNEQRAVQLVLLLGTAVIVLVVYLGSLLRELPAFPWPFWFVLSAGLVSSAFADFKFAAFGELGLYAALAGLVFTSAIAFRSLPGSALWLKRAVLLLGFAHCLGILVRYGTALSMQRDLAMDVLLLGFANPRFASALYVLLMPFLASHALCADERRFLRGLAFATLAMLWAFNLALGTRAVFFGMAAGLILFAWYFWGRRPLAIVWTMLVALAAGVVLYAVMFQLAPHWLSSSPALVVRADPLLNPNGRQLLLQTSLDAIWTAPLLGIGPMQFATIPHVWAAHPHNWMLQLAVEYGLPAAVLAALAVVAWFLRLKASMRSVDDRDGGLFAPALLTTLVALVYGLVDGNYVMPVSQSAAAIALGALIGSLDRSQGCAVTLAMSRYATALAVATAAVAVGLYGHVSFADQKASVERFRELYSKDRFFVPRFWEQGLITKPIEPK